MADATTTVQDLREHVRRFVHDREWEAFHTPKDLAIALCVEASELLERFLWRESDPTKMTPDDRALAGEELADVLIYGMSLAEALELDLSRAVLDKLRKDEARYPADQFRGRAR